MASMLTKGRCDYAILNNYNATSVFHETEFCHFAIYQSPQPTSDIDLTILMRPKLHETKTIMDEHLETFISSGKADKSLLSHTPKPSFPKTATCH
jgi:polar amino acid transport system substrate-binding protein